MYLSHILQYTIQNRNVHISVLNGVLCDMGQVICRICVIGLMNIYRSQRTITLLLQQNDVTACFGCSYDAHSLFRLYVHSRCYLWIIVITDRYLYGGLRLMTYFKHMNQGSLSNIEQRVAGRKLSVQLLVVQYYHAAWFLVTEGYNRTVVFDDCETTQLMYDDLSVLVNI